MSVPDNSYSTRMRRLKQKQDALYARNTVGSQLSRPFNTNISPTGSVGNIFMLGTVIGSQNEVNTSPLGRVNNDIACICTGAVEEVAAAPSPPIPPTPELVFPNITYMIPGSAYGFALGNLSNGKGSVGFKLNTSGGFEWQISYDSLSPIFEAYLMEYNGIDKLYVAGSDSSLGNTTNLLVIDSETGVIIKNITYTNKTILSMNEISNKLYVTYCEVILGPPAINSYIDIYDLTVLPDPFATPSATRTYNNAFIRGKILLSGSTYYSIVWTNVIANPPSSVGYDIDTWSWSSADLTDISKTSTSLFTSCTKPFSDLLDPKVIISSPQVLGILNTVIMIECVNGLDTFSNPVNGLTLYGYDIGLSGPLPPAILSGGALLSTINVSDSILILAEGVAYIYVIAGTTTSRIYGYDIGLGAPIIPSAPTNYTVTNTQFTTDGTNLYRFEYDGIASYSVAQYLADTDLSGAPVNTLALPQYGVTPVYANIVWDGTNIYVNTDVGIVSQYNTNLSIPPISTDTLTQI